MNTKQKTLTYIAVAAIGLTSLVAAWDLTGSTNHTNVTHYAPIFAPPDLGPWAKRELASSVFWSWLVIGGMYSLMFVALRETSTQTRRQMDEQAASHVMKKISSTVIWTVAALILAGFASVLIGFALTFLGHEALHMRWFGVGQWVLATIFVLVAVMLSVRGALPGTSGRSQ